MVSSFNIRVVWLEPCLPGRSFISIYDLQFQRPAEDWLVVALIESLRLFKEPLEKI